MQKARDEAAPVFTPRGNSLKVSLGGVTDRAGAQQTPRVSDMPDLDRSDIDRPDMSASDADGFGISRAVVNRPDIDTWVGLVSTQIRCR